MTTIIRVPPLYDERRRVNLTINLPETSVLYIPKSNNDKTGAIPTQYIGASLDQSKETCIVCPLYRDKTCYSQNGTPVMGFNHLLKAHQAVPRSLNRAMKLRQGDARYARFGAIGDPGSIHSEVYDKHENIVRGEGLGVLSYTHHWKYSHANFLKGRALASIDTLPDLIKARDLGWTRLAVHVNGNNKIFNNQTIDDNPRGVYHGLTYMLCPAQRKRVTCNMCGLCDASRRSPVDVIVFREHGVKMKAFQNRKEKE